MYLFPFKLLIQFVSTMCKHHMHNLVSGTKFRIMYKALFNLWVYFVDRSSAIKKKKKN